MQNIWIFILAIGALLLIFGLIFLFSVILLRRATKSVINSFRKNNALEKRNAKTREELGLIQQSATERLVKAPNYKLNAMELLIDLDVIRLTFDQRLYLSEEKLESLEKRKKEGSLKLWKILISK
ncbi:hypothetical protein [Natranaerofaba carboxydovora]|uniref:hypothetical protein n=1 Tax=Natranaerofaba carboxydovora TaxID=2742683 RepID=UPI001F12A6BB|nr:hypothetical protein [Natranaerofaba carboxydovora]UMZ73656.1 hypothetical protein ACONDI_01219 [Natranaerofaba carboxydovora]